MGGKVLFASTLRGVRELLRHGAPIAFARSFANNVLFCAAVFGPACIFGVMLFSAHSLSTFYVHTPIREPPKMRAPV